MWIGPAPVQCRVLGMRTPQVPDEPENRRVLANRPRNSYGPVFAPQESDSVEPGAKWIVNTCRITTTRRQPLVVGLLALNVAACTGFVLEDGLIEPGGVLESACGTTGLQALEPRRLTRLELSNSLEDLFGVTVSPSDLPADSSVGPFLANRGGGLAVTDTALLFDATEAVAPAVAPSVQADLGCNIGSPGCAETLVDRWGPILYRRLLLTEERTALVDFAARASAEEEMTRLSR